MLFSQTLGGSLWEQYKQIRLIHLKTLRGIAALFVVLYHFEAAGFYKIPFMEHAWLMVDFFFVLSGFVIALNYQARLKTIKDAYNFQLKRFFRLYPLHLLMLLVFLGIECMKYMVEIQFDLTANNSAFSTNDFYSFVSNIFLLQNFTHDTLTWNIVSWSISAEFYTYILFVLVVVILKNQRAITFFALIIVALSFNFLEEHGMGTASFSGPVRCTFSFFMGVIVFNVFNAVKKQI